MEKLITVSRHHNQLQVTLDGNQSYLVLKQEDGQLLRKSNGRRQGPYTYTLSPGKYVLETDGDIVKAQSGKHKVAVEKNIQILDYQPEKSAVMLLAIDGQMVRSTAEELVNQKQVSLAALKPALLRHLSDQAQRAREALLPTQELLLAVMGVRDDRTLDSYRQTLLEFENVRQKYQEEVHQAKTVKGLVELQPRWPKKLLVSKPKAAKKVGSKTSSKKRTKNTKPPTKK